MINETTQIIESNIKEIYCLDCKKLIEKFAGSIRINGNKNIIEHIPNGIIIYGDILGYVCYECSLFRKVK